jgi:hypothetical protein
MLRNIFRDGRTSNAMAAARLLIRKAQSHEGVFEIMQGSGQGARCVVWSFKNTVGHGSGTIEYRGGRHFRGPNRTFWRVTFAVAFISLSLREKRQKVEFQSI